MNKNVKTKDNFNIFYRINKKSDKFLIFLHGWPLNHTCWKKEWIFFEKQNYSTIAIDLRGHGKSDKPTSFDEYTFQKFSNDVDEIIKFENIKDFVLVSHSLGGIVAQEYYLQFPKKANALVLIDTTFENPLKNLTLLKHLKLTPLTEKIIKLTLQNKKLQQKQLSYIDFSKFKTHNDFYYWLKGAKETTFQSTIVSLNKILELDNKSNLSKINVPTLILEGENDFLTPIPIA